MTRVFSLFLLLSFFINCKNNTQISEHFVYEYNKIATETKTSLIYNTYAKLYSEKIPKEYIIDVIVELTIKKHEYNKYLGFRILTKEISNLLTGEDVEELIKTGGKITLKYRSFDNFFVEEKLLDINDIKEIKQYVFYDSKKTLTLNQHQLIRELEKMNQSFPYSNEDGTKLIKLELDEWNNINCYVEYDGNYEKFSKYYFKERMLDNKYISALVNKKNKYNIISITYKFENSEGQKVLDYMTKP